MRSRKTRWGSLVSQGLGGLLLALLGTTARAQEIVPIEVRDVDLRTNDTLATVVLRSEEPVSWSVEPQSRTLVVFLPRTVPGPEALDRSSRTGLVSLVEVGFAVPDGVPTTRITVHARKPFEHEVEDSGAGLTIRLQATETAAASPSSESPPPSSPTAGEPSAGADLEQAIRENEALRRRLGELHADRLGLRQELDSARKELAESQAAARENDDNADLTAEKLRLEEELSAQQALVAKTREDAARLESKLGDLEARLASAPAPASAQVEQQLAEHAGRARELEQRLRESRADTSALRAWLSRAPEILQAREFVVGAGESCLSLHPEPNPAAAELECLPAGAPLEALSFRPDWLRVRTAQGKEGWVGVARVAPPEPTGLEERVAALNQQLEAERKRANALAGESERAAEFSSRLDQEAAERRSAEGALEAAQHRIAQLEEDVTRLQTAETGTESASAELEAARAQAETDRRRLSALLAEIELQRLTVARDADPCLTVRGGPGTDRARLDCLEPGTVVSVEDATADWLAVRAPNGVAGWVASRFIDTKQNAETSDRAAELERQLASSRKQSEALAARIMALGTELEASTLAATQAAESRDAERDQLVDQLDAANERDRETRERLQQATAERQQAQEALAAARERQRLERAEALGALKVTKAVVKDDVDPCLSFREEPAVGSRSLDCLAPGTPVSTVALAGGWFRIRLADGREGWSSGEFLESVELRESRELRERLAVAETEAAQAAELRRALEESRSQTARVSEELAALRDQSAESELQLVEARQEIDRLGALAGRAGEVPILTSALEQARGALGASEQKIEALEQQLAESSEAQPALAASEAARQELDRTVGQLREEFASKSESLEEARLSNAALAEQLSNLEAEQANREGLETETQRLRAQLSDLETELDRMRESIAAGEAANDTLRSELSDLEAERSRLASERDRNLESAAQIENLRADLAASKRELAEATARSLELQASREELVQTRTLLDAAYVERDGIANRLAGVEVELDRTREAMTAGETANAALRSELSSLEAERSRLASAATRGSESAEQVERLQAELAGSQRALSEAAARNRELEAAEAELALTLELLAEARSEREEAERVLEPLPSTPPASPEVAVVVPSSPLPSAQPAAEESELPAAESPEIRAADLEAFALAWAHAWSEQRVADYLSFYSAAFVPPSGMARTEWESLRSDRLTRPEFIEVELSNFDVGILGPNRATVTFEQEYRSNTFQDRVVKTLELVREGDLWRIGEERAQ